MRDRKICWGCFNGFYPDRPSIKYCSQKCRNLIAWEKQEARLLDTGATDEQLEKHRRNHPKYRTRKILLGDDKADIAAYTKAMAELREERIKQGEQEDVNLDDLIKRDKGKCYLCGKKVAKRRKFGRSQKRGNMSNYPTVDHVIPISRGGTHTWNNVKLAHFSCNSRKGGRMLKAGK